MHAICCLTDKQHELPSANVYAVWETAWEFEFTATLPKSCFLPSTE